MRAKPEDKAGSWVATYNVLSNGKTQVLLQDDKEFTWLSFPTPPNSPDYPAMKYAALMKVLQ